MPIVISRIGNKESGRSVYEVCVGDRRIALFTHDRNDGLEVCLMSAALAVRMESDDGRPLDPELPSGVESLRIDAEITTEADAMAIAREAVDRLNVCVEIAARAVGRLDQLHDRCDGLAEDLRSAVEVAFSRGAREWTQLNYPKDYDRLLLLERARETSKDERSEG